MSPPKKSTAKSIKHHSLAKSKIKRFKKAGPIKKRIIQSAPKIGVISRSNIKRAVKHVR